MANPYGLYGESPGGVLEMGGGRGRGGYSHHPGMLGGGGGSEMMGGGGMGESHLLVDANGAAVMAQGGGSAQQQQSLANYGLSMGHHASLQQSKLQHYATQYATAGDYATLSPRLHHMVNSNQQLNPAMNSMIRQQQQQQQQHQHQMHSHQQHHDTQQHHETQQYQNPSQRSVYSMHETTQQQQHLQQQQQQQQQQQTQNNPMQQLNSGMMWANQPQYHHLSLQHRPQQQQQQQQQQQSPYVSVQHEYGMELSQTQQQQQQQQQAQRVGHYNDRGLNQMSHIPGSHKMAGGGGLTFSYPDPTVAQRPTVTSAVGGGVAATNTNSPHMYSYGDVSGGAGASVVGGGGGMIKSLNPYSSSPYGPNGLSAQPSYAQMQPQGSQGASSTPQHIRGGVGGDPHNSRLHYTQLTAQGPPNGSPQYRASYPQQPQPPPTQVTLSPRRPTPTPPTGSPMVSSAGCHTPDRHIISAAQAQGTYRTPSPSLSPSLGQSSLQQLEQMVMPHRSSPLPPHQPPSHLSQTSQPLPNQQHSSPFHHSSQLGPNSQQQSSFPGSVGVSSGGGGAGNHMAHHVSMTSVASPGTHNNQQVPPPSSQQQQQQRVMSAGHTNATSVFDGQLHQMYNVPQNTPPTLPQQQQTSNKIMNDVSEQLRMIHPQQQINSHLPMSNVHSNQVNLGVPVRNVNSRNESLQQTHLNSMQMNQQQSLLNSQQSGDVNHMYSNSSLLSENNIQSSASNSVASVSGTSNLLLSDSSNADAFLFDLDTQPLMPMAPQLIMPVDPEEMETVETRGETDQMMNESHDSPGLVTLDSRLGGGSVGGRGESMNVVDRFNTDDLCDNMVMTPLYPSMQVSSHQTSQMPSHQITGMQMCQPPSSQQQSLMPQQMNSMVNMNMSSVMTAPMDMQLQMPIVEMPNVKPKKAPKAPKKPKQPKAPRKNAKTNNMHFTNSNSSSSCSNDTNLMTGILPSDNEIITELTAPAIIEQDISSMSMERFDEPGPDLNCEEEKKPKKKKQYKKRKKTEEVENVSPPALAATPVVSVIVPDPEPVPECPPLPLTELTPEPPEIPEIEPVVEPTTTSNLEETTDIEVKEEEAEAESTLNESVQETIDATALEISDSAADQTSVLETDITLESEEIDAPPKAKKSKWKKSKDAKAPKEGRAPKKPKKPREPKTPKEPRKPKETKKAKEPREKKAKPKVEPKDETAAPSTPATTPTTATTPPTTTTTTTTTTSKSKSSKLNKRRPTKILLSFSKKRRRASGSDVSDCLEGTPPPSPTAEAEGSVQKRRSARNTKRKKYTDDIDISISDDDDTLPIEPVQKVIAQPTEAGLIKPVQFFVNPNDEDAMLVERILAMRTVKKEKPKVEGEMKPKVEGEMKPKVEGEIKPEEGTEQPKLEESEDCEEIEEFYVKYKNFSYLHCDWKTSEDLEKGDRRVGYKIKRYKQKKQQSNNIFEFLEEEAFNPEYVEIDRLLDVSETTDEVSGITTKHYLVKWRGLAYDESTWELEEDIEKDKIEQFIRFRLTPPKDQLKCKKRPKPDEWVKQPLSRDYKHGNILREYQLEGLNWLTFCWYNGLNCILADEMGLGKTIQSIAYLCEVIQYGIRGPFLVIAPLSTITNWQREFETWSNLNVIVYHGSAASRNMIQEYETFYKDENGKRIPGVYKFNAMITTFEMIITDCMDLREIPWRAVIIDEAHRLKNKNCKLLEGLRLLSMEHRVLLSGTPLQNNVEELFSLLNFLEPLQFASFEDFMKEFADLKSESQVQKLQQVLKPMMLRRLKEDVEKSLAPKEETIIEVELTNIQKKYYRAILERNFSFLAKGTSAANVPNLMNTMMELRKCCIHPYLINGAEEQIQLECKSQPVEGTDDPALQALIQSSGKLVLIDKLLPKLRDSGHRVLIFSQMVRCLDILEDYLVQRRYPYERIDGRVRGNMRQAAIDRFSKPDSDRFVFLLCTRAGGLGINLTAADTVIIFDSDWNPQNDLQAQARCHRIGQLKAVKCYRLICRSTYEREMFDKASLKLGLDKAVLQSMNSAGKDGVQPQQLTKKEIEDLLRKGAYGAIMDDDNAADQFCEEDIDQILERRTQVIQLESGVKGSTFAKASFVSSGNQIDIDINDPDFWHKWAKKADIDLDAVEGKNELIVTQPRRRIQTRRFGNEDQMLELTDLESSDDDDNVLVGRRGSKKNRRKKKKDDKFDEMNDDNFSIIWGRSECFKVEKGLLIFGWGRWRELIGTMKFRMRVEGRHLEDIARIILLYCLNFYRGDEKIKNAIWELIVPANHRLMSADGRSDDEHRGLISPTSRQRKSKKAKKDMIINNNIDPNAWAKDPKYDAELWLTDETYKKHLQRHANRILLRIRLLCYLKQDIIGDLVIPIAQGTYVQDLKLYPPWPEGDTPVSWWDHDADKSILVGVYKHGYEKYNVMRLDPTLSFLARCGPPDGAAVLAEINDNEGNEEEMEDKVQKLDEDEEALSPPPTPKRESTPMPSDSQGLSEKDSSSFPSVADLNTRFRRLIAGYQRNHRKREQRLAQNAKRIERQEKFQAAIRERELRKRELQQRKWSRREEADFYRVVSTFGVEFEAKENRFNWSRFRSFARLEKKLDDTITEYYRAFYSMCKKVCGKKLEEDEEHHPIVVEPISEERARRCLEKVDLLNKIREEIIPHPELNERLKLCKPSADLPDWWICSKHDKELLFGAAKHGLGRLDYHLMHDPQLCFNEILKSNPKPNLVFNLRSTNSPLEKVLKESSTNNQTDSDTIKEEDIKPAMASELELALTKSTSNKVFGKDEKDFCRLPQVDLVVKPDLSLHDEMEIVDSIDEETKIKSEDEEGTEKIVKKKVESLVNQVLASERRERALASEILSEEKTETTDQEKLQENVEDVKVADAKLIANANNKSEIEENQCTNEAQSVKMEEDKTDIQKDVDAVAEEMVEPEKDAKVDENKIQMDVEKLIENNVYAQAENSEEQYLLKGESLKVITESEGKELIDRIEEYKEEEKCTLNDKENDKVEDTDLLIQSDVKSVSEMLDDVNNEDDSLNVVKDIIESLIKKTIELVEGLVEVDENCDALKDQIKTELPDEINIEDSTLIKNEVEAESFNSLVKKEESINMVDSMNYNSMEMMDNSTSILVNSYHNQVRWPKERVLQMRLEAVVHCVEKNEWPPMPRLAQMFSVPSVSQSGTPVSVELDSSTPQGTPDHTPKRETPWNTPTHLSEKEGSDSNNPPEPIVNNMLFPPRRRRRRRRIEMDERGSDMFPSLFSFQLNQKNLSSNLHHFHQQQSQQQQLSQQSQLYSQATTALGLKLGLPVKTSTPEPMPQISLVKKNSSSATAPPPAHQHASSRMAPSPVLSGWDLNLKTKKPVEESAALDLSSNLKGSNNVEKSSFKYSLENIMASLGNKVSSSSPAPSNTDGLVLDLQLRRQEKKQRLEEQLAKLRTQKTGDTPSSMNANSKSDDNRQKKRRKLDEIVGSLAASAAPVSTQNTNTNSGGNSGRHISLLANLSSDILKKASASSQQQQLENELRNSHLLHLASKRLDVEKWLADHSLQSIVRKSETLSQHHQSQPQSQQHIHSSAAADPLNLLVNRHRRRQRGGGESEKTNMEQLTGNENVAVVNRVTGKKITGSKAPPLKHLAEWLTQNPMFDVDAKWAHLVKEKVNAGLNNASNYSGGERASGGGSRSNNRRSSQLPPPPPPQQSTAPPKLPTMANLPEDLQRRLNYSSNRRGRRAATTATPTTSSHHSTSSSLPPRSIPTSLAPPLASAYSSLPGLGALSSLANASMFAGFPGLKLPGMPETSRGNSSVGNSSAGAQMLLPFGGLAGLGLTNPLFANLASLGFAGFPFASGLSGLPTDPKSSKENSGAGGSSGVNGGKSGGNSNSTPQIPLLFPNPGLLYNPLGLGGFSIPSSVPSSFSSLGLMNGLCTTRPGSFNTTTTPSHSFNPCTPSNNGLGVQDDSDEDSLKSLMGNNYDDDDSTGTDNERDGKKKEVSSRGQHSRYQSNAGSGGGGKSSHHSVASLSTATTLVNVLDPLMCLLQPKSSSGGRHGSSKESGMKISNRLHRSRASGAAPLSGASNSEKLSRGSVMVDTMTGELDNSSKNVTVEKPDPKSVERSLRAERRSHKRMNMLSEVPGVSTSEIVNRMESVKKKSSPETADSQKKISGKDEDGVDAERMKLEEEATAISLTRTSERSNREKCSRGGGGSGAKEKLEQSDSDTLTNVKKSNNEDENCVEKGQKNVSDELDSKS